jgi:hypothetical protein
VGYLLYLVYLYVIGAMQGPDSMGYGWLPLLASTFPWSFLFDPMAGQGLHVGGAAGMIRDQYGDSLPIAAHSTARPPGSPQPFLLETDGQSVCQSELIRIGMLSSDYPAFQQG